MKAVITGQDVPGLRIGRCIYDTPVLADGIVRFIGEKVAAVAAETKQAAEQALDLIEVEYDEMEPLLDPVEAAKDDAPVLHPDLLSYKGLPVPVEKPATCLPISSGAKGDIEAGFKQADLIVENTFTTQVTHQSYLEPHACVVQGGLVRQRGYLVVQQDAVRGARPAVQLHWHRQRKTRFSSDAYRRGLWRQGRIHGCSRWLLPVRRSGLPVKMVMDYTEELIAGNPRHAAIIKVKTGVKKNGTHRRAPYGLSLR